MKRVPVTLPAREKKPWTESFLWKDTAKFTLEHQRGNEVVSDG
jgi:hypothetical protein